VLYGVTTHYTNMANIYLSYIVEISFIGVGNMCITRRRPLICCTSRT